VGIHIETFQVGILIIYQHFFRMNRIESNQSLHHHFYYYFVLLEETVVAIETVVVVSNTGIEYTLLLLLLLLLLFESLYHHFYYYFVLLEETVVAIETVVVVSNTGICCLPRCDVAIEMGQSLWQSILSVLLLLLATTAWHCIVEYSVIHSS